MASTRTIYSKQLSEMRFKVPEELKVLLKTRAKIKKHAEKATARLLASVPRGSRYGAANHTCGKTNGTNQPTVPTPDGTTDPTESV